MALIDLEDKILEIVKNKNQDEFIYNFLKIYDIPNSTITKLKNGTNNLSNDLNEVHLKNKLYFRKSEGNIFETYSYLEEKINDLSTTPRYLITTDFNIILAKDTKTGDTLDIPFEELPIHFDFFLAWNGIEKVDFEKENPLDIKAAERFTRLFDELNKEIDLSDDVERHALNLFLMRFLFCLFSEDTGIFEKGSFTNGIKKYTDEDGRNMNNYISGLFKILDLPFRDNVETIYRSFPYVNGQLFFEPHKPIHFNTKSRKLMIECGELLEWSKINPDIFGSMIQAVATEDNRGHLGMHYTSVPNIMKVINPLFLEEIKDQFEDIRFSWENSEENHRQKRTKYKTIRESHEKRLEELMTRIRKMKFFDPACGSGNFLIITYKELRKLEIQIYKLLNDIRGSNMLVYNPIVSLTQFHGIEIDEFASDIAKLSLWITEHQMNLDLKVALVNAVRPTLPLKAAGDIRHLNALKADWNEVCSNNPGESVYLFGNPPYLGAKKQNPQQKEDLYRALDGNGKYKKMDYISAWLYLGAKYINNSDAQLAFVSTNSIVQGEQVSMLWPSILELCTIRFGVTSFKWANNAKNQAGVTVVIISLVGKNYNYVEKRLYVGGTVKIVKNISPYLVEGNDLIVSNISTSISSLPKIVLGNLPLDGGNFIFSKDQYFEAIEKYPNINICFKKYIGAKELLNQTIRYVLWLDKNLYHKFSNIGIIEERISKVRLFRENGGISAKNAAETSYEFYTKKEREDKIQAHYKKNKEKMLSIIIPRHTSEKRLYIPMSLVDDDTVIADSCMAIYDAPIYLLGILSSRMHMVWVRAIGGKLETRLRYSGGLCYNTFPMPEISKDRKKEIENIVFDIIDLREEDGRSLGEMYNEDAMSNDLKLLHQKLDEIVDKIYQRQNFFNDEERLEKLLSLYTEYIMR